MYAIIKCIFISIHYDLGEITDTINQKLVFKGEKNGLVRINAVLH